MSSKTQIQKQEAKKDLYLNTLEIMAVKDKSFSSLLLKIKNGLMSNDSPEVSSQPKQELQTKINNYERVMKEMKKQIAGQKTEIQQIKQMEQFLSLDNYQKLINEFNTLYEHYKGLKQINKKMKMELKQSNQRERTFLKLLKRTQEYGDQATKLELEYDRLFKEDQRLGLSVENLIIDSNEKR